jgi:FkbM family methyltransferase
MNELRRLSERFRSYATIGSALLGAGVKPSSVLLFPIRRRLRNARNQLDLAKGLALHSPPGEPLLAMFREIWIEGCYRPRGLSRDADATIVDIGSNVGVFAIWAAVSFPRARVIAVEPAKELGHWLRSNLARNGLENVTVVETACGGAMGSAVLNRRGPGAMNTLYAKDNYGSDFTRGDVTRVVTLEALFDELGIESCDLLKLDCEGAEYEILLNSSAGLLARIDNIVMEYHVGLNDHTPAELARHLEAHGFSVACSPLTDVESGYLRASRAPNG